MTAGMLAAACSPSSPSASAAASRTYGISCSRHFVSTGAIEAAWVAGVGLAQGVRRSLADAPVPVLEELHDRRDAGGRVLSEL